MKLRLNSFGAAVISGLLTVLIGMTSVCPAQSSVKHVPDSACAAIVFKPKSAMADPAFDLLPREVIAALGTKELNMNLMDLNLATVLLDKPVSAENPPDFGAVFQFESDQTFGGRAVENLEEVEFEGRKAYQIPDTPEKLLVVPMDARTVLVGTEPMLTKMISAENVSSNLVSMMQSADPGDHAGVFVSVEDLRDIIRDSMPPEEYMSDVEKRFRVVPGLIKSVYMRHSFAEGGASLVTVVANNERDAKKLEFVFNSGVDLIKTELLNEGGFGENGYGFGEEDYDNAMRAYADRMANLAKDYITASRTGDTLSVDLTKLPSVSPFIGFSVFGSMAPFFALRRVVEAAPMVEIQEWDTETNIRQIMIALHNYHDAHGSFPDIGPIRDEEGNALLSWRVAILPFIEQQALYNEFHLDEPWDSEHNIQLLDAIPMIYISPNREEQDSRTIYLGLQGENMMFNGDEGLNLMDVANADGTAVTLAIVEANPDAAIEWTKPADLVIDPENPGADLGAIYDGSFYGVMMDASGQYHSLEMGNEELLKMFRFNDGDRP